MMIDVSRGGAVWSARVAHNHKVAGSNPTPATKFISQIEIRFLCESLFCCHLCYSGSNPALYLLVEGCL